MCDLFVFIEPNVVLAEQIHTIRSVVPPFVTHVLVVGLRTNFYFFVFTGLIAYGIFLSTLSWPSLLVYGIGFVIGSPLDDFDG